MLVVVLGVTVCNADLTARTKQHIVDVDTSQKYRLSTNDRYAFHNGHFYKSRDTISICYLWPWFQPWKLRSGAIRKCMLVVLVIIIFFHGTSTEEDWVTQLMCENTKNKSVFRTFGRYNLIRRFTWKSILNYLNLLQKYVTGGCQSVKLHVLLFCCFILEMWSFHNFVIAKMSNVVICPLAHSSTGNLNKTLMTRLLKKKSCYHIIFKIE